MARCLPPVAPIVAYQVSPMVLSPIRALLRNLRGSFAAVIFSVPGSVVGLPCARGCIADRVIVPNSYYIGFVSN